MAVGGEISMGVLADDDETDNDVFCFVGLKHIVGYAMSWKYRPQFKSFKLLLYDIKEERLN